MNYQHTFEDRDDGLSYCTTCGGGEGSLPTCCPGKRLTADQLDAIYAGTINFHRGPMDHRPVWWARVDVRPIDTAINAKKPL